MGNYYSVAYRVLWGLEKWGMIEPVALFGWRIINSSETDFVAPLDFGIIAEINLTKNFSVQIPAMISLFSKSNMFDFSINLENKGYTIYNWVFGMRKLAPLNNSSFLERTLFLLGLKSQL
ncbi:MAG: hypothetical protein FD145_1583 [Candidatus Saganbacteria bacterium]|uniref:Uncharacterized protein n=1 Tax=Candidatus Saganbacteria bacterium TaxID=2575572 RepID=A0A833NXW2_UNCSA|nr:MAG: hypothetical protein FD145_1583 [Candidatus Saganbacteria bacterium]